jgi:hypothetical protein
MPPTYALGIHSRRVLGEMLTDLNYSIGVEIGTHKGIFARQIAERWNGTLHCIDPWNIPPGYESQAEMLEGSGNTIEQRQFDHSDCIYNLDEFRDRVHLHRYSSQEAVDRFKDNELDFIYIDGDHRPEMVHADLLGWFPKIRKGGMISGHDWLMPGEEEHSWGKDIQRVVSRFCDMKGIDTVYLIPEKDGLPWSFYFFIQPYSR